MKRVAVLRGGPSAEYEVSLKSGGAVLEALRQLEYPYKDIVITKRGEWLENGIPRQPDLALDAVDVVFIALHGKYGEDGQVQRILERKRIPFTGSRALASAIAFNKELTKRTLMPHGIKMPRHRKVTRADLEYLTPDEIELIFTEVGEELFVKPISDGSSLGAQYVPNETVLTAALDALLADYEEVMVEQFIRGREATVGVLSDFRDQPLYVLPVIEIVPPDGESFSYENKYNGRTQEIVPGRFSFTEKAMLSEAAELVHRALDCDHYSRSDFIVRDGDIYFLEVNTLPGLTRESLFPKASAAVGLEFPQLIEHLVENAHR
jgi:D-alanine-D-alanine ligase